VDRVTFNPRLKSLGNGFWAILRKRKLFDKGLIESPTLIILWVWKREMTAFSVYVCDYIQTMTLSSVSHLACDLAKNNQHT